MIIPASISFMSDTRYIEKHVISNDQHVQTILDYTIIHLKSQDNLT